MESMYGLSTTVKKSMGAEGLEPSRFLQSTDFKSAASTIPPRPLGNLPLGFALGSLPLGFVSLLALTDVYCTTKRADWQLVLGGFPGHGGGI